MSIDLKRLRALAEAADRGEWMSTGVVVCAPAEGGMKYLVEQCHGSDSPNLEYIAAANPDVMLQLLDRLEKAAAALNDINEIIYAQDLKRGSADYFRVRSLCVGST